MKQVFNTVDGLSPDMVITPGDAAKRHYDLLVVDEAHRLYQRFNLPGQQLYAKFDRINKELMGDCWTKTQDDFTELDWIFAGSRLQVLFYDVLQRIRAADIPKERFDSICKPHFYTRLELKSQLRCKGGNGYYEYVKKVLESEKLDPHEYQSFESYDINTVDSIGDLCDIIAKHNKETNLCRILLGPGWATKEEIVINETVLHWVDDVTSIHRIQGFDLNYAGVIFGKEVYYDTEKGRICVNKKEVGDPFIKAQGDEWMHRFVFNTYLTLMTRGIFGTYVYAVDSSLHEYLRYYFQ